VHYCIKSTQNKKFFAESRQQIVPISEWWYTTTRGKAKKPNNDYQRVTPGKPELPIQNAPIKGVKIT
jgi:hypothetical protein